MNLLVIVGHMAKDPNVSYGGANNTAVARFTVAVDRRVKIEGQPTADFIPCVAFGKTAEFIEKYFHKGNRIGIRGEWRTGQYTDKNGNTVFTNDCNVDNVEFVESKSSNSNQQSAQPTNNVANADFMQIPDGIDENLPFS